MKFFKLPRNIYHAFIEDAVRFYKVMPNCFRIRFWSIFIVQFLYALLETCTILVIAFFALSFSTPDAAKNNFVIKILFDFFPAISEFCSDPRRFIAFCGGIAAAFIASKNAMALLTMKMSTNFAEDMARFVGEETLRRYLNKSYMWHISPGSADIIHRMSFRTSLAELLISLLQLYSNVICCIALFASLFIAEPGLTLLVIFVFGMVSLVTYMSMRKKIDRSGSKVAEAATEEAVGMTGVTHGIREVIIYRQQDVFLSRIVEAMRGGAPSRAFLTLSGQVPAWLLETAGFATIFGVTIMLVAAGTPMSGIITAISMLMLTAWRVLPAVNRVMSYAVNIRGIRPRALTCLALLETFVREEPERLPDPDPDFRFEKDIVLENISFKYPSSKKNSLENVTFKIKKGQSIGLIGSSGAGKSTLALLMCGLLPPKNGRFLIDGIDMTPPMRAAYIEKVGFVPQNPILMGGTVADNVAFSQLGKKYDRMQVEIACRQAAMNFIFEHPSGIDYPLGQGGAGLSGGQAQRVSIARALFTNPNIIIFDEATSALDQANENVIKSTIERLPGDVTAVIIAHRLTTVEKCDFLIWLEKGQIRAMGTPDKILSLYNAETEISSRKMQEKEEIVNSCEY